MLCASGRPRHQVRHWRVGHRYFGRTVDFFLRTPSNGQMSASGKTHFLFDFENSNYPPSFPGLRVAGSEPALSGLGFLMVL